MGQQQLMLVDEPSASMSGSAAIEGEEPVSSSGSDKSSRGPASESGDYSPDLSAEAAEDEDMEGGGDTGEVQKKKKKRRELQQQQQEQRVLMPAAAAVGALAAAACSSEEQVVPTLCEGVDAAAVVSLGQQQQQQQERQAHVHKQRRQHKHAARGGSLPDDAAMADGDDEFRPRAYYEVSDSMGVIPAASLSTACSQFARPHDAAAAVGGGMRQQQDEEGGEDVEMDGPAGDGLLLVQEAARLHIANAGDDRMAV